MKMIVPLNGHNDARVRVIVRVITPHTHTQCTDTQTHE